MGYILVGGLAKAILEGGYGTIHKESGGMDGESKDDDSAGTLSDDGESGEAEDGA